jgi:hypothetical protein
MKLPDEAITEFQEIYFERFGQKISREKAQEEGMKLLRLVKLVYSGNEQTKTNNQKEAII